MNKIFLRAGLLSAVATLVITTASSVSNAGSITSPGGTPAPTSYTLTDIYNQIANSTDATAGSHTLAPTTTPQSSFHSLTDIYNAAVSLHASAVSLANMWTGTCDPSICNSGGPYTGGSQANGGVDDMNWDYSTLPPPDPAVGRYSSAWQICDSSTDYCGLGDAGKDVADMKDTATGLIWSWPCTGVGCLASGGGGTGFDNTPHNAIVIDESGTYYYNTDTYYTWSGLDGGGNTYSNNAEVDSHGAPILDGSSNPIPLSASQLCSQHAGWYLPNQKQLMMAYIDGSYGNLDPVGVDRVYWSATTGSSGTQSAWYVGLAYGRTSNGNKFNPNYTVRCVRE